ncbi:MAG: DUF2283 domain-containing protein [Cyanobacteria bacterium P01_A01_bin.123]
MTSKNVKLNYFEKEDILHLAISDGAETASVEISPNITAEFNEAGKLIGVEIVNISSLLISSKSND